MHVTTRMFKASPVNYWRRYWSPAYIRRRLELNTPRVMRQLLSTHSFRRLIPFTFVSSLPRSVSLHSTRACCQSGPSIRRLALDVIAPHRPKLIWFQSATEPSASRRCDRIRARLNGFSGRRQPSRAGPDTGITECWSLSVHGLSGFEPRSRIKTDDALRCFVKSTWSCGTPSRLMALIYLEAVCCVGALDINETGRSLIQRVCAWEAIVAAAAALSFEDSRTLR